MENINKEEISTETTNESTNQGKQNYKPREPRQAREPRAPRAPRTTNKDVKENNTTSNDEINDDSSDKKPEFKKRRPTKPRVFNNKNLPLSGDGWTNDLKKSYMINEKIHKDRLNPHYKLNLNTNAKLRITPLGGLNEIGGNMMVVETENEAIIVDVGMSFPDADMHGVDILIPDFTYLREIKDKIVAVIITHGHEDHIGAMPYLYKEMQFPIYGSPLPLEMIGSKFDEHKMREHRALFRAINKRVPIKIGNDFEVEWMHITHSIIDSSAIAIKTAAGTMIHTGDFKIDHTPYDGFPTDIHRLAHYGEEGVLVLTSDSTNSHTPGFTKTEKAVAPTFERIFSTTKGRVIMSTFSSNIHRVAQAIEKALKYGRKICVIGRSMEKNLDIAMTLGYIKFPKDQFIEAHEVGKYNDNEIMIVTTGSQGESMSALYRMAIHEHRHIKIKPEDQIILSSKAIPGNEGSVSEIINHLLKAGANVAYQDYSDIHVSGHAAQEEQKLMLRLVKPKFFLPVHGEYNHALKHSQTGIDCGVLERNVYIMADGEQVEVSPKYLKKVRSVKSGKVYIDNTLNHKISDDVVIDRQNMAKEGIVMIVAQINENDKTLAAKPKVASFGLISDKQDKFFVKEIEDILALFVENVKPGVFKNSRILEDELRKVVRKHCIRKYKKYPMIVPTIFVQ
ncbi:ribonuclease J [Aliarcobacter thereius]|uniref:ribonuclease J n=1 Tax=Aliarcobacter thereius TaxID=544718 RepID=UPI0010FD6120|nr:ribonuclease J [Aliarcobacter thereius]TLT07731.1 ribonuclease J [Aliarcobacter thereius]